MLTQSTESGIQPPMNTFDKRFKQKIVDMIRPDGHRHSSFQEALLCKKCQPKVLAAKEMYDTTVKKHPHLIRRSQPKFQPSQELQTMWGQLQERVRNDKLYQKHLEKTFHGTIEEQNLEADRVNSGFYEKHSDYKKLILPT